MKIHADYETFSEADVTEVGAHRMAEDPSTRIMLMAVALDDEDPVLWVHPECETPLLKTDPRAIQVLRRARAAQDRGEPVEWWAHNAMFERAVSNERMREDIGISPPPNLSWRCSAAVARKASMPPDLAGLGKALGLTQQKDSKGKALIRKFCQPVTFKGKKATKKNPVATATVTRRVMAHEFPEDFRDFGEYCLQDVRTEQASLEKLEDFILRGESLQTYLFDIEMNEEGVPVNVPALLNARRIIDECQKDERGAFIDKTGYSPTQRERVVELLAEEGLEMPNMKQPTIEAKLNAYEDAEEGKKPFSAYCYDVLLAYARFAFAAAKKVHTMLDCVCRDGRIRGSHLYHGASTGRWSGRLHQPQNFKKPTIKGTELAYKMICDGCSREDLELLFGNPLEVIASCIRNFIHWKGGDLFDADYAAIEARIVCWLAGQEDALVRFRKKIDSYKVMAGLVYGVPPDSIGNPSAERDLGKEAVLGGGFGMGWDKFHKRCHEKGLKHVSVDLAKKAIEDFRSLHDRVQQFWWDSDKAARQAIGNVGTVFRAGRIRFQVINLKGINYLLMTLPSGRCLSYPHPKIEQLAGDKRPGITFYGHIKGATWGRVRTYGGKLVENATQAVAADVMSQGSRNALAKGYRITSLIHDQALALFENAEQSIDEFCDLLIQMPKWADGLPLKAEGKVTPYYRKG